MLWDAEGNRVRFTSSTDQSYPYYFVYDATAGIPAVIEEVHDGDSVFYVREPGGALIARFAGATTNYYGFDELGNTLFLTASNGTVSDKYTYDAWGNVTSHTGSTNQPYQYVGRLGYYTHWQDSNMGDLLQLGVRFYEPGTTRFTQIDEVKNDKVSSYLYCTCKPTRMVDPDGRQAFTYPVFIADSGCSKFSDAAFHIAKAQQYVSYVVDTLSLGRCPSKIKVKCYEKTYCGIWPFKKLNRQCGLWAGFYMSVNWAPQCSSPYCIILHEMIHACNVLGHKQHAAIGIPGCGAGFGPVTGPVP